MKRLSPLLIRIVVSVVVAALVIGGGVYLFKGDDTKTVAADFASAVGVYPGTPVKILGINVGEVTKVEPEGDHVRVIMTYDKKYRLPANAKALMVANSLVSDRYVQLAGGYDVPGPVLADHATIQLKDTASPAELDDIYGALSKLAVALGPEGANKTGSLSTFLNVSAANLQGNGAAFGQTITKLSQAAKTLADGRLDLFGTVKNLQVFTSALQQSDTQIRNVESELAQVSGDLADERSDLGTALHTLAGALDTVSTFVKTNAAKTHTDLAGLSNIANILVNEQSSLNETLAVGPAALANIVHAYQPDLGVIASRGNLDSLLDPGSLCDALNVLDFNDALGVAGVDLGTLLGKVGNVLGSVTKDIASACNATIAKKGGTKLPAGTTAAQAKSLLQSVLTGNTSLGGLLPGN